MWDEPGGARAAIHRVVLNASWVLEGLKLGSSLLSSRGSNLSMDHGGGETRIAASRRLSTNRRLGQSGRIITKTGIPDRSIRKRVRISSVVSAATPRHEHIGSRTKRRRPAPFPERAVTHSAAASTRCSHVRGEGRLSPESRHSSTSQAGSLIPIAPPWHHPPASPARR